MCYNFFFQHVLRIFMGVTAIVRLAHLSVLLMNVTIHRPHDVKRGTGLFDDETPVTVICVDSLCIRTEARARLTEN